MWGHSCPLVALFLLWYFIISVSVHVCVYDVGCFVDVLASRSEYSGRKPSVPMIAILLSSSLGLSIEWLTGVSQVLGSRPDVFSCELKIYSRCHSASSNLRPLKSQTLHWPPLPQRLTLAQTYIAQWCGVCCGSPAIQSNSTMLSSTSLNPTSCNIIKIFWHGRRANKIVTIFRPNFAPDTFQARRCNVPGLDVIKDILYNESCPKLLHCPLQMAIKEAKEFVHSLPEIKGLEICYNTLIHARNYICCAGWEE